MLTPVTVVKLALLKICVSWVPETVTVAGMMLPVAELVACTTTVPSVVLLLIKLIA